MVRERVPDMGDSFLKSYNTRLTPYKPSIILFSESTIRRNHHEHR